MVKNLYRLVLMAYLLILMPAIAQAQATTEKTFGIGVSAALSHVPQESALSDTGGGEDIDKFEIYFDWLFFRLGYNKVNAKTEFSAYKKRWTTYLKTNTTYAGLRLSSKDAQTEWDFYGLAGLAYVDATLTIGNILRENISNFGFVTGVGIMYSFGDFSLGPQYLIFNAEGTFEDIVIATGSTQSQLAFKYIF